MILSSQLDLSILILKKKKNEVYYFNSNEHSQNQPENPDGYREDQLEPDYDPFGCELDNEEFEIESKRVKITEDEEYKEESMLL